MWHYSDVHTEPDLMRWIRSTFCSGGNCVEAAKNGAGVIVRDSKNPDRQPIDFSAGQWAEFLDGVAAGEFR